VSRESEAESMLYRMCAVKVQELALDLGHSYDGYHVKARRSKTRANAKTQADDRV
jgi:hypothetical protein